MEGKELAEFNRQIRSIYQRSGADAASEYQAKVLGTKKPEVEPEPVVRKRKRRAAAGGGLSEELEKHAQERRKG